MATDTTPPPETIPSKTNTPALPPLNTSPNVVRRLTSQRQPSYTHKRLSAFSPASRRSDFADSRPPSHVFPAFHSSLSYTLVRDFAYLTDEPMHYGPLPDESGLTTPASETRRLSDPAGAYSWHDAKGEAGEWPASPPWISDNGNAPTSTEQLPSMTFTDGGPPYSEDEDLQSPVVTTSKHKKHKSASGFERGRSPGSAGPNRGTLLGTNGDGSRQYYYADPMNDIDEDGPGGEIVNDSEERLRYPQQPYHRDSNFARPLQRNRSQQNGPERMVDDEHSEVDEDHEDSRYSKDYSFTIASPDEEMHGKAVALFDFAREHENELPLREGQIILVSYRHGQGWLVAQDPKTGESGLVPEEFVRLVRDIEGGLNGLDIQDSVEEETQEDPETATTPTPNNPESKHVANASNGSNASEKHPPVQSKFSTSSKDLEPYPLPTSTPETASPVRSERMAAEAR